jgi:hypothetical protein
MKHIIKTVSEIAFGEKLSELDKNGILPTPVFQN